MIGQRLPGSSTLQIHNGIDTQTAVFPTMSGITLTGNKAISAARPQPSGGASLAPVALQDASEITTNKLEKVQQRMSG